MDEATTPNATVGFDLTTPVVSIVVPCFNRAGLVGQVVESVRRQTLCEWELIVVDDGSSDDLPAALRSAQADARVRLIRHEVNRGVSAARNTGIAAARGRFVAFLDSDDEWLPRKLELQLAAVMATNEPERAFCVTRTEVKMPGGWSRTRPIRGPEPGRSFAEYLYSDGGFAQCSSFFLSTALARKAPFREGLRQYEDHLFFAEAGAGGATYLLVPEVLTVWRNDARPDRLGARDSLPQARLLIDLATNVLPRRALQAFEARALFHLLWASSARDATGLLWRAVRDQALTPRQASVLFVRNLVPSRIYQALLKSVRRFEPARTGASS